MKGHYVYVSSRARAWSSAGITDNDLFIVTARVSGIATTIIVLLTAIVLNRIVVHKGRNQRRIKQKA